MEENLRESKNLFKRVILLELKLFNEASIICNHLGDMRNMVREIPDSSLNRLDSSQLEMMEEMCLVVDENDNIIRFR